MINALIREVDLQRLYLDGEELKTVYFGGGTPSLLSAHQLDQVLSAVGKHHQISQGAEITLEANPDDLSKSHLADLRTIGVNRLSIGIQSFDDRVLKFLNRAHNATKANECIALSRQAGFDNISIDLIYSIPNVSLKDWHNNIEGALRHSPEHISAYSLTIEEQTVFGAHQKRGKIKAMGEEASAQQFELMVDVLEAEGYEHYEISNFCKPTFHSRHNSSYWYQEKYLGIGPSAHSFNGESRQFNVKNNAIYIRSIENGSIPFQLETLTEANKANEYILISLRTSNGCDLEKLKTCYDLDLAASHKSYLEVLLLNQLILIEKNHLVLTRKGKLVADKIASDLFIED
jgi:oxygen-independent coproporphyrinogen-3 oxidase